MEQIFYKDCSLIIWNSLHELLKIDDNKIAKTFLRNKHIANLLQVIVWLLSLVYLVVDVTIAKMVATTFVWT